MIVDIFLLFIFFKLGEGLFVMFMLLFMVFVLGGIVGLVVLFVCVGCNVMLQCVSKVYIQFFQNMLLFMQMFIVFFGVFMVGFEMLLWMVVVIGLMLYISVYLVEVWCGCVEVILCGQWEVFFSLVMGYFQQMWYVVLLQVVCLLIVFMVGFFVQIVKGMVVVFIIGFEDLFKLGLVLVNVIFQLFFIYGLVVVVYFVLCWLLFFYVFYLEKKFYVVC